MKSSATPLRRTRKRLAAMAVLTAVLVPGSALACNPIEALFGGCRMDAFRPAYNAPDYESQIRVRSRPRKADASRERKAPRVQAGLDENGVSDKQTPLTPTQSAPSGSLALFKQDSTLESGDIVVTNEGFRVFRGGEFRAIAREGKLAELEKVSLRGQERVEIDRETSEPRQALADRRR